MKYCIYFGISVLFLVSACVTQVTMLNKGYPPVAVGQVKLLFNRTPKCNNEQLAMIKTPMQSDQNTAVNTARKEAAKMGADYLNINQVYWNNANEAMVFAIAYKCIKEQS